MRFLLLVFCLCQAARLNASTEAWITDSGSDTVFIIDTETNSVAATISSAQGMFNLPWGIVFSPDGVFCYIVNDDSVSVISTAARTLVKSINLSSIGYTIAAITPNGFFVYATNSLDHTVAIIDTSTNTVSKIITMGEGSFSGPRAIAISPDGSRAYVGNIDNNTVSVIDTATNTLITVLPGVTSPLWIAFTPDGAFAYVVNSTANTVSVIRTSDFSISVISMMTGMFHLPFYVTFSPDGLLAYVTNVALGFYSISILDTATNTLVDQISQAEGALSGPASMAVTTDGLTGYVLNTGVVSVSVIDLVSRTLITNFAIAGGFNPKLILLTPPSFSRQRAFMRPSNRRP